MDRLQGDLGPGRALAGLLLGDADEDHLRVRVAGISPGHDPGDPWLLARIEVAAGVFRALAEAPVLASEVRRFRDALVRLAAEPRGRAALETEDGWLAVRLFGDGFGHFDARCELRDPDATPHRLEFTIGLDARALPALVAEVDAILARAAASAA